MLVKKYHDLLISYNLCNKSYVVKIVNMIKFIIPVIIRIYKEGRFLTSY